jgi:H+/gluconate symporter-like permease
MSPSPLSLIVSRDRVPLYTLKRNERGAVEVHMHYWPRPFEISSAGALHAFVKPMDHLIGIGGLVAVTLYRGAYIEYKNSTFIQIGEVRAMEQIVDESWDVFLSYR